MANIPHVKYANFGQRFAAIFIDTIPLVLLQWALGFMIGQSMADDYANGYVTLDEVQQKATAWGWIIGGVVSWLYFALFESSEKQATPGKMVFGLTVTDLSGARLSFGQATGRHFSKLASSLILFIGYLMPLWTQKKQALHDIISGCLIEQRVTHAGKSGRDITPNLESLQGGELDSKEQTSSGSAAQLNRAYQPKTALSAEDLVRLEQITSLRDRGTLSQSQFEAERDNILGAAEPISQDVAPEISLPPPLPPTTLPPPSPPPSSSLPPPPTETEVGLEQAAKHKSATNLVGWLAFLPVGILLFLILGSQEPNETEAGFAEGSSQVAADVSTAEDVNVNGCYAAVEAQKWNDAWYHCPAATEKGDAGAATILGYMHSEGKGMAENNVEAVRWFRKAAEQGDVYGQYNLGVMFDNGDGVTEDDAEAVRWLRKAAEQGYAPAQNYLGVMFDNGDGVTEDNAEAVRWYRKAAEQGDVDGQYNLGMMYDYGEGVAEDDAEAVRWLRKAAEQGRADAKKRLAELGY
jgi:TPR repeat protein/uncharacterized RDD family membrane protein YckC